MGTSGRAPGRRGAGGVREAEEKGTGGGRNRENYATLQIFFHRIRAKRREPTKIGREPGLMGMGGGGIFSPPNRPPFQSLTTLDRVYLLRSKFRIEDKLRFP